MREHLENKDQHVNGRAYIQRFDEKYGYGGGISGHGVTDYHSSYEDCSHSLDNRIYGLFSSPFSFSLKGEKWRESRRDIQKYLELNY